MNNYDKSLEKLTALQVKAQRELPAISMGYAVYELLQKGISFTPELVLQQLVQNKNNHPRERGDVLAIELLKGFLKDSKDV